ncbi:hypothetical protein OPT61_g9788 [Boeremia exigua]|uniref:Uncharacterized protein n=1 Tax=Boeremia exigua TaxID=749465 RepID=A0ACC2HSL0_9PLEO|nr:hypothetical protein OPT61_g9788 [Boeremia exigua]
MATSKAPKAVETVGYIGLGNAGFSMASNLPKKGFNVVVYDIDAEKVQKAAQEWENTAASDGSAESFKDCDMIVTMLPQGKVVREVVIGKGIAKALRPGTIIVDTSSSSPFDTQSLGRELASHGLTLVDAPITQTYMHATDAGESTLMVGADSEDTFNAVKPVLSAMAGYLFHMGPLGSGHAMKTLNNYIMAASICALNDSLVTGQKWGLDPQQMLDVLNVGTGVCFPTLDTFRRDALPRTFNSGFGLALLVKDLGITQDFMRHSRFETQLPGLLRGYLGDALQAVDPRADHTESIRGWEKRAGLEVKKTETVQKIPEKDFKHRLGGVNRELPPLGRNTTMAQDNGTDSIADGLVAGTSFRAPSLSPKKAAPKKKRARSIGPGGLEKEDEAPLKASSGNRRKVCSTCVRRWEQG